MTLPDRVLLVVHPDRDPDDDNGRVYGFAKLSSVSQGHAATGSGGRAGSAGLGGAGGGDFRDPEPDDQCSRLSEAFGDGEGLPAAEVLFGVHRELDPAGFTPADLEKVVDWIVVEQGWIAVHGDSFPLVVGTSLRLSAERGQPAPGPAPAGP